ATLLGQGLSGTIDMQSIRPLSFGERRVTFSGQGEYNSLGKLIDGSEDTGYRISASYVDQFANDTVGFAIGVARMASPFQEEMEQAWWWGNPDAWGAPQAGKPPGAVARQAGEAALKSRDITRDGVMAVLEFKPNDTWHSLLDVYYSKFDQDEAENSIMWNNDPWWSANGQGVTYGNVGTTQVGGVPVVTSGTLLGVGALNMLNELNTREDELFSAGWANTIQFADIYTLKTDLSYSRAESTRTTLELQSAFGSPRDIAFNLTTGSGFNRFSIPGLDDPTQIYLGMDAMGWGRDGRTDLASTEDTLKSGRIELNRLVESSDFLRSYDVGVNVTRRDKDREYVAYYVDLKNGRTPVRLDAVNHGWASMDYLGLGDVPNLNARDLVASHYDLRAEPSENDLMKNYGVEEDIKTFYFKANLDMDLTDNVRLLGNVGVQYVRSKQSSTGPTVARDPITNDWIIAGGQTIGASYGDILPSMNLSADFGNGTMLRFAAAKTMMRGPIEQMGAYTTAAVDPTTRTWSGYGGNPKLEPYRATAYDISLEKYFGPTTYAALAVFYKNLETYVYTQNQPWDFTGYDDLGITPISPVGNFSRAVNGSGGYMRGAELSGALGGDMIHPSLDGFGLMLNASYTESSIDPDGPGGSDTDTLPGLSKVVANATVYYEKHGFSARVSQRYRDEYRGEYSSLFGDRVYQNTMAESTMDLQLGYDFSESSRLAGLSILLQVNNVTNEPYRTEVSAGGIDEVVYLPMHYREYGRQYLVGARYAF
ncbi:MAG TPA: TonB-dependent receptor, partial [Luteimonas sp.]|nr:TonB-dependent receptor [Luteimonas sp.]